MLVKFNWLDLSLDLFLSFIFQLSADSVIIILLISLSILTEVYILSKLELFEHLNSLDFLKLFDELFIPLSAKLT
jgi:hypothetical protein